MRTSNIGRLITRRTFQSGFTLIEFIIVVMIIAILAAIAIPNFMEAQVRSVVSRSKSDLAVTAQALESYYTDHESYPLFTLPGLPILGNDFTNLKRQPGLATIFNESASISESGPSFAIPAMSDGTRIAFSHLTSPVAYIREYPIDPFDGAVQSTYFYAADRSAFMLTGRGPANDGRVLALKRNQRRPRIAGSAGWLLPSHQLAAQIEEGSDIPFNAEQLSRARRHFEMSEYDPTNGTVSAGEIVHLSK